jgi:hypothetical protein
MGSRGFYPLVGCRGETPARDADKKSAGRPPAPLQRGKAPLNPFGMGSRGFYPLVGCRGETPARDVDKKSAGRPPTPAKGQSPFEPLWDGVKGILSPCGVQGVKPLQEMWTKKAQDDLLHLQRGKAPLNPFGMGSRGFHSLVGCRVRVDTALRQRPCKTRTSRATQG